MLAYLSRLKHSWLGQHVIKTKIIARNRKDLGTSAIKIPWLASYDFRKIDREGYIKEVYDEYVNEVSTADKAISLELAYLLWFILERSRPKLIVDLGSGFSSFLFRHYQSLNGKDCRVFSCDDDESWMERTANFLQCKNLSVSELLSWDRFIAEHNQLRPDLILHDLGHMPVRLKTLPLMLNLCSPETIAIVDDVHKSPMRLALLDQIRGRGLRGYDLTCFTYDRFGRYAWMLY